jgi:hypothetical protein
MNKLARPPPPPPPRRPGTLIYNNTIPNLPPRKVNDRLYARAKKPPKGPIYTALEFKGPSSGNIRGRTNEQTIYASISNTLKANKTGNKTGNNMYKEIKNEVNKRRPPGTKTAIARALAINSNKKTKGETNLYNAVMGKLQNKRTTNAQITQMIDSMAKSNSFGAAGINKNKTIRTLRDRVRQLRDEPLKTTLANTGYKPLPNTLHTRKNNNNNNDAPMVRLLREPITTTRAKTGYRPR